MAEPNDQLRRARERTTSPQTPGEPLSRAELAEQLNAWVYEHTPAKRVIELDANYIGKLERGLIRWPHADYRAGLRGVLGVAADRELGFRRPRRHRPTLDDVDRQQFLRAALGVSAAAVTGIPLTELITSSEPTVPSVVGLNEVDEIHTADRVFDSWDNRHGGGMARQAIMAQLRYCAELLNARCPMRLRADLCSAVGQLGHTSAFMAFDAYAHDDAWRLFQFSLSCAEEAEDWQLRAAILSNVARHAFWLGDFDGSLTHIEFALVRSDRLTPTQRAMLHTGRARVLARLGRTQEAVATVGIADEEFSNSNPAKDPSHVRWYDEAEHAGETGHALADLATKGHFVSEATTRLTTAIERYGDNYVRARTFSQIKLASLTMAVGDPREAAAIGADAVTAASTIRSYRITDTLRELRQIAAPHQRVAEVADLRQQIGAAAAG